MLETQIGELIFGKREVETTRGTFELARNPKGYDPSYAYMLAVGTRAAGVLSGPSLDSMNCDEKQPDVPRGSVVLTSDTRATTAFHIIRTDVESFKVNFESPGADFVDDTNFLELDWRQDDLRFGNESENPFLSNRLFALSLTDWVETDGFVKSAWRQALREWRFKIDIVGNGSDPFAFNTFANQGFLPLPLESDVSRDVVVLKAIEHTGPVVDLPAYNGWGSIRPFPLTSPAVFFDQVEPAFGKYGGIPDQTSIYGVGVGPFPGDTGILKPLALLKGEKAGTTVISGNHCHARLKAVNLKYDIAKSNLDSRSGLSGSAVLSSDRIPGDNTRTDFFLQTFGVLSFAASVNENRLLGWGENSGIFDDEYVAVSSLGDEAHVARRDDFLPPVIFAPNGVIPCGTRVGVVWEDEFGNTHDDRVCSYDRYSSDEEEEQEFEDVEIPQETPIVPRDGQPYNKIYVSASCSEIYFNGPVAQADPGYMYGIMGALNFGSAGSNWGNLTPKEIVEDYGGGLGSFFAICGPHSNEPYTSNWRFLRLKGNHVDRRKDALEGPYFSGYEFRHAITRIREERVADGQITARPPSFKMCPPGSIMRGVVASREADPVRYTGIKEIICAEPNGSDTYHSTIDVPQGQGRDYQIFGRPFDLSQFVGWPTGTDDPIICGPGYFARHLRFRVKDGLVNYIGLDCDP